MYQGIVPVEIMERHMYTIFTNNPMLPAVSFDPRTPNPATVYG